MICADDEEASGLATLWESGRHLLAGADYLAALQRLGLDPECLFWAEDEVIGHPVLVLVTEQFDRVGPLELSRTLFKAYDRAGTPREVNPFILRLHSPAQAVIRDMSGKGGIGDVLRSPQRMPSPAEGGPSAVFISAGGMKFKLEWIYKWSAPTKATNVIDLRRRWRRFAENVDRLAA